MPPPKKAITPEITKKSSSSWVNVPPPLLMQSLPLVQIYICPRCRHLSSQRQAIRFESGLHYTTVVQCARCLAINKNLASIASGLPYAKKEDNTDKKDN